jgi:Protein of unknown function (DUF3450)
MWRLASIKTQFRARVFWGLGTVLLAIPAFVSAQEQSAGERYAKILAESESLARYNEQLTSQLDSQQAQVVLFEQQLAAMDATAAQVPALIKKMFDNLETHLASDLPFLDPTQAGPDSRQERMERIRELMAKEETASNDDDAVAKPEADSASDAKKEEKAPDSKADTASSAQDEESTAEADAERALKAEKERALDAERYRRLLEAYQIELEYGRTMVSYKGKLEDGREADFVRVGRVTLLYRTADGEESGYWDAEQKKWVVANEYNKAVESALLIATKESAPDLIMVPVPAPQEVPL